MDVRAEEALGLFQHAEVVERFGVGDAGADGFDGVGQLGEGHEIGVRAELLQPHVPLPWQRLPWRWFAWYWGAVVRWPSLRGNRLASFWIRTSFAGPSPSMSIPVAQLNLWLGVVCWVAALSAGAQDRVVVSSPAQAVPKSPGRQADAWRDAVLKGDAAKVK